MTTYPRSRAGLKTEAQQLVADLGHEALCTYLDAHGWGHKLTSSLQPEGRRWRAAVWREDVLLTSRRVDSTVSAADALRRAFVTTVLLRLDLRGRLIHGGDLIASHTEVLPQ